MQGYATLGNLLPIVDAELWPHLGGLVPDQTPDPTGQTPMTWSEVQGFQIAPTDPDTWYDPTEWVTETWQPAMPDILPIAWLENTAGAVARPIVAPLALAGLAAVRLAEGAAQAVTLPQRVMEGEYGYDPSTWNQNPAFTAEAMNFAGLLSLGPLGGPRGSTGSGMTRPYRPATDLPMDEASRMARVRGMGFDMTLTGYHGTNESFPAFGSNASPLPNAVSVAVSPAIADEFAMMRSREQGSAQTYPLRIRSDRRGQIVLDGTENHHEVLATLADAFDSGYDSVLLRNYSSPNGLTGQDIIWVRDPSQLRSVYANFDPARRSDSDLLAAAGVPLPLPPPIPSSVGIGVALPGGATVMTQPQIVSTALAANPPAIGLPRLGPAWAEEWHAAYQNPNSPEFAARLNREAQEAEERRAADEARRAEQVRIQAIRDGSLA